MNDYECSLLDEACFFKRSVSTVFVDSLNRLGTELYFDVATKLRNIYTLSMQVR